MAVPAYKRALSYLFPIPLERAVCNGMDTELVVYRNRLQLGTADAVYSDGMKYMPALEVANHFPATLTTANSVLVLGAGLCSAVPIFMRAGFNARFTLVEQCETILHWAVAYVLEPAGADYEPLCEDAQTFVARKPGTFDFVFVDVFVGRYVPFFVSTPGFLNQLRCLVAPGGNLALNYIVNDPLTWVQLRTWWVATFPAGHIIEKGENRILIA